MLMIPELTQLLVCLIVLHVYVCNSQEQRMRRNGEREREKQGHPQREGRGRTPPEETTMVRGERVTHRKDEHLGGFCPLDWSRLHRTTQKWTRLEHTHTAKRCRVCLRCNATDATQRQEPRTASAWLDTPAKRAAMSILVRRQHVGKKTTAPTPTCSCLVS